MIYAISIIICILALVFYRSKLMFSILIGEAWILFAGAYGHADFLQQKQAYDFILTKGFTVEDPLWWLIVRLLSKSGISYRAFLWIISTIVLFLIARTIFLYTKNVAYVWVLYFISPMILDVVQYNNFVGMAIVIFATQYLIKGNRNLKMFLILVGIATGICSYMIVYFAFACIPYFSEKKILAFSLIACAVIFTSRGMIFWIASRLMKDEKIVAYFNRTIQPDTYFFLSAYVACGCLLAAYAYHIVIRRRPKKIAELNQSQFSVYAVSEMIVKINYIMLITIAIQSFSLEATRLYRNIFILNYILLSLVRKRKDYELRSAVLRIAVLFMAIGYSYLYIYYWNEDTVLIPVMEHNAILNWIFERF